MLSLQPKPDIKSKIMRLLRQIKHGLSDVAIIVVHNNLSVQQAILS